MDLISFSESKILKKHWRNNNSGWPNGRHQKKSRYRQKKFGWDWTAGGSQLHWNLVSWSTDHEIHRDQWENLWTLWNQQRGLYKLRELFVRLRIDRWSGLLWTEKIRNHERERTCKISVGISHHQTKHGSDPQATSACPASAATPAHVAFGVDVIRGCSRLCCSSAAPNVRRTGVRRVEGRSSGATMLWSSQTLISIPNTPPKRA